MILRGKTGSNMLSGVEEKEPSWGTLKFLERVCQAQKNSFRAIQSINRYLLCIYKEAWNRVEMSKILDPNFRPIIG